MSDDELVRMVNYSWWSEGYAVGVQDSMLRATQIERILTDLIADLQNPSFGYNPDCQQAYPRCNERAIGESCPAHYEAAVEQAADKADQLLLELTPAEREPRRPGRVLHRLGTLLPMPFLSDPGDIGAPPMAFPFVAVGDGELDDIEVDESEFERWKVKHRCSGDDASLKIIYQLQKKAGIA